MIENSLYEGALYQYRDPRTGEGDEDSMVRHLVTFWSRVYEKWPVAWELPPRKSRLTHGVGIQALGYIMDLLTADIDSSQSPFVDIIDNSLELLAPFVAWTAGFWRISPGDERRWNGLQNTPNDVRKLTNLFIQVLRQPDGTGQLAIDIISKQSS
jgi:hypothetical protein